MNSKATAPTVADFWNAAGNLAVSFGWPAKTSEQGNEAVVVALTPSDPMYERMIWVYDTERITLRCMLVSAQQVPAKRSSAILELCARVNEGLPFGCAEYSFGEKVVVFRDSADLGWQPVDMVVKASTARALNLGRKYAAAIRSTLAGKKPETAIHEAESA